MQRILVCDDDDLIRDAIADQLAAEGYETAVAANGEEALAVIDRDQPDALVLDLRMPRVDGIEVLRRLRAKRSRVPVIVMTATEGADAAIEATKLGAFAYLPKPLDPDEVSVQVGRALDRKEPAQRDGYGAIIGRSDAMQAVFNVMTHLETVRTPTVLITGETGTGKDLVAREIHAHGRRANKPFLAVDCASIPETLLESELFGHERGSFTDAKQQKRGLLELVDGGTLFLDEIGEMPFAMQSKLLRALQNKSFRRVGGLHDLPLDASIIAATNRDLAEEVLHKRFRADLLFRLNVIPIAMPPLRDRGEDIEIIAEQLVAALAAEHERDVDGIDRRAAAALRAYPWPGNVRELANVLERSIILKHRPGPLTVDDLPSDVRKPHVPASGGVARRTSFELPAHGIDLAAVEHDFLLQALARARGNQTKAAQLLGISRFALRYRLEKYGSDKADDDNEPDA